MCSMYGRYVYLDVAKTCGKSRLGIPIREASGKWLKLGFPHIFNRRQVVFGSAWPCLNTGKPVDSESLKRVPFINPTVTGFWHHLLFLHPFDDPIFILMDAHLLQYHMG